MLMRGTGGTAADVETEEENDSGGCGGRSVLVDDVEGEGDVDEETTVGAVRVLQLVRGRSTCLIGARNVRLHRGHIVDYHSCDFFPERWFDAVFVLRTSNEVLYPRLCSRGYKPKKIQDLIHCEIVQVILDEARESYAPEIVHELQSETLDDLQKNVADISAWIQQWKVDHAP
ncbi:Adenylate kinase isoenzyme 6 [Sparganum proliferum]